MKIKKKSFFTIFALIFTSFLFNGCLQKSNPGVSKTNSTKQVVIKGDDNHITIYETTKERDARMQWWRDAKFGMFIHYGLYSGLAGVWDGRSAGTEWIQKNVEADTKTYQEKTFPLFKPAQNMTKKWASLAKNAGCQYAVLTSKHHEGFALFKTKQGDLYSSEHHFNRDIVKEFTDAFREKGLRIGLYHSVIDWHQKDYDNTICPDLCYPKNQDLYLRSINAIQNQNKYKQYLASQVREILTQYGTIDIIWWDYSQGKAEGTLAWNAPTLIKMCHEINPNIIMNNRLYAFSGIDKSPVKSLDLRCGDYTTPEKHIPTNGYPDLDWESCMTVGDKWGYNRFDTKIKSSETVIGQLCECTGKGGNLLLNINPMVDGTIPPAVEKVFLDIGKWLKINGSAIYSTRAYFNAKIKITETISSILASSSINKKSIFIFIPKTEKTFTIILPEKEIVSANLLNKNKKIKTEIKTLNGTSEISVTLDNLSDTQEVLQVLKK